MTVGCWSPKRKFIHIHTYTHIRECHRKGGKELETKGLGTLQKQNLLRHDEVISLMNTQWLKLLAQDPGVKFQQFLGRDSQGPTLTELLAVGGC